VAKKETKKEKETAVMLREALNLLRKVVLESSAGVKMNFKGKTMEGGNYSGDLQVEKSGEEDYHIKINMRMK